MRREKVIRGVVIAFVLAVAGYHAFAVTMASLPTNRYSTAVAPGTQYLHPFFTQNWRLFAPNPVSSDRSIQFQGEYEVDGERHTTEWLDWTDVELDLVRHRIIGGRAGYITNKFYSPLQRNHRQLTDEQRAVIDGEAAVEFDTWTDLRDALVEAGPHDEVDLTVDRWVRYERAAAQLATQALTAVHPDLEFTAVRYRLQNVPVVPFEHRDCDGAECEPYQRPTVREPGWRLAEPGSERSQQVVTEFWERHR